MVLIIFRTPITTACQLISGNLNQKFNFKPPCAGHFIQIRTEIRTQNCTCRWPLCMQIIVNLPFLGRVKTRLVDSATGATSDPCCMRDPMVNQKLFAKLNWFSSSSGSSMQGYGLSHSKGEKRASIQMSRETKT
jgi:hypothetical protein